MKKILLLGASGSIGRQSIDVMKKYPNDFLLVGFSVGSRTRIISSLIKYFSSVKSICIKDKKKIKYYKNKYPSISFYSGEEGLANIIKETDFDMGVNALVGFVGLKPSIEILKKDKILALANKESLVVGGEIINKYLKDGFGKLYPIDSEHVGLAKCLSVDNQDVDKLIITASGGAFRDLNREELNNVTKEMALNHPTWKMGHKITIDSATMVNKAFEIIEAHYLFNYPYEKIDVILHKESNIHAMVKYLNETYRVDKSKPDMRIPIKYALFCGLTTFNTYLVNSYLDYKDLSFKPFDINRYPVIKWAKVVIDKKGTYGAVFNAVNEEAVYAFLSNKISFLEIEYLIDKYMNEHHNKVNPSLDELILTDCEHRKKVNDYILGR